MEQLGIFFDEHNGLRIMDPDKAEEAAQLADECQHFVQDNQGFINDAQQILDFLTGSSKLVEYEKKMYWGRKVELEIQDTLTEKELTRLEKEIESERDLITQYTAVLNQ